jgi:hypothetical protein
VLATGWPGVFYLTSSSTQNQQPTAQFHLFTSRHGTHPLPPMPSPDAVLLGQDCDCNSLAPQCLQVLLLEAYEQLERDVGKEVDRALGGQAEELQRLGRRVAFLEDTLKGERDHVAALQQQGAELQEQLDEAMTRCKAYESGVYGLPQVRSCRLVAHLPLLLG